MQRPSDDLDAARAMVRYISEQEAAGHKLFRPENYSLMDPGDLGQASLLATLEGCGTHRIYQLDNGMCILTIQPTGQWPAASCEWVIDDTPRPYAFQVLRSIVEVENVVSGRTPHEIAVELHSFVGDAVTLTTSV